MSELMLADLLAVPDDVDDGHLMLTVQLTPWRDDEVPGQGFDLERWPAVIAAAMVKVSFRGGSDQPIEPLHQPPLVLPTALSGFFSGHHANGMTQAEAATKLWQRIFAKPGWGYLAAALTKDNNGELISAEMLKSGLPVVASSQTALIGQLIDALPTLPMVLRSDGDGQTRAITKLNEVLGVTRGAEKRNVLAGAATLDTMIQSRTDQIEKFEAEVDALAEALSDRDVQRLAGLDTSAIRAVIAEFDHVLGLSDPIPDVIKCPPTTDWSAEENLIEVARSKLSGINQIPTLAHFFGLGVQVKVPIDDPLRRICEGFVKVELVDNRGVVLPGQKAAWTAFELNLPSAASTGPSIFTPRAKSPKNRRWKNGLLRLDGTVGGKPCFRLSSTDAVNSLFRLRDRLENSEDGDHHPGFDRLRRGIALHNMMRPTDTVAALVIEAEQAAATAGDHEALCFTEDIEQGYRPDVAIAERGADGAPIGGQPPAARWRPLTARKVICKDPIEGLLDTSFYGHDAIERIASHDHSVARMLPRVPSSGQAFALGVEDELFVWGGESIGLSPGNHENAFDNGNGAGASTQLEIDIALDFADVGCDATLPPLREGAGYFIGCRQVFPLGVSRRFADVRESYDAETTLGATSSTAFVYKPEIIPAPVVAFHEQDPLVVAHDASARLGETIDDLVLRDAGPLRQDNVMRIILPPRIEFDRAEIESQFDQSEEPIPDGVLSGTVPIRLFGNDGALPEARSGKIYWTLLAEQPETDEQPEPHEEPIPEQQPQLMLQEVGDPSSLPFPLPNETDVGGGKYAPRGPVALIGGPIDDKIRYYTSVHARAVSAVLTRQNGAGGTSGMVSFWTNAMSAAKPVVISFVRSTTVGASVADKQFTIDGKRLDGLEIKVGPGEVWALALTTCNPRDTSTDCDEPNGLQRKTARLSIVHALRKPTERPCYADAQDCPPANPPLGLNAVTVTVAAEQQPQASRGTLSTWRQIVERNGTLDQLKWPSEEGGSTTFFIGRIRVNAVSTGRLRCLAEWDDYDSETFVRVGDTQWEERKKPQRQELFAVDLEPELTDQVDLLTTPGTKPRLRNLSLAFADGRARRLFTTMHAISRFDRYFVPKDGDVSGCTIVSNPVEVWVDCIFRPPPPAIDRVVPIFEWTRDEQRGKAERKTAKLRFYLAEGWYASGEGEQLALVLAPGGQTPPEAFEPFVTRPGGDPTRPGAKERPYFTADDFPALNTIDDVELVVTNDNQATSVVEEQGRIAPSIFTSVIPLEVKKENGTNALYCDVTIGSVGAYTPFIQFGLARFQPNAVKHLRLSPPIQFQAQLLPSRRIGISGTGPRRTFTMAGEGYSSVGSGALATRSTLDLTLLYFDRAKDRWIAASLDPAEYRSPVDNLIGLIPKLDARGQFKWTAEVALLRTNHALALLIEEYEHIPADTVSNEQPDDSLNQFTLEPGARLVFSHIQKITGPG